MSPKFLATSELGRLAKWLRILGYDVLSLPSSAERRTIVLESLKQERVILTRDSRLSRYGGVRTLKIKSEDFREQLKQVRKELALKAEEEDLFSRCVVCNTELESIEKKKVKARVPAHVYETQEQFAGCKKCKRVYWAGTHWGNMKEVIKLLSS